MKQILKITGMTCSGCEQTVNNKLSDIKGVRQVIADRMKQQAEVETDDEIPVDIFQKALSDTHYQITETVQ
jgi:copper chaperone